MESYTNIKTVYNKSGVVTHFILKNNVTKQQKQVDKQEVKEKLAVNPNIITNLKLDSAGRIIDKIDKKNSLPSNNSVSNNYLKDMTNKELLNHIEKRLQQMQVDGKKSDKVMVNELLKRYGKMYKKLEAVERELTDLKQMIPTEESLTRGFDDIKNYLESNMHHITEIKDGITNLNNQISQCESDDNSDSEPDTFICEKGKYEMPESVYEAFWCKKFLKENANEICNARTDQELLDCLKSLDMYFENASSDVEYKISDLGISIDTLNAYRQEIEKYADKYYYTEQFYEEQLEDLSKDLRSSQLLGQLVGSLSNLIPKVNFGEDNEVDFISLGKMTKEAILGFGTHIGMFENEAKREKIKLDFYNKEELPAESRRKLLTEIDAIWNCGIEFISKNEEWEIMLYVIQTLNKLNLKTFSVGTTTYQTYLKKDIAVSNKGNMEAGIDTTLLNTSANALTEKPLNYLYNSFEEAKKTWYKAADYEKLVYDRFIICYFAAKKLLYGRNAYPFDINEGQPKVNGVCLKLVYIGLLLCNVNEWCAIKYISDFYTLNNKSTSMRYRVDLKARFADLSR